MSSLPEKENGRSSILTRRIRLLKQPRCRQNSSSWSTEAAERSSSTRFNSTMTFGPQVSSPAAEIWLSNGHS